MVMEWSRGQARKTSRFLIRTLTLELVIFVLYTIGKLNATRKFLVFEDSGREYLRLWLVRCNLR